MKFKTRPYAHQHACFEACRDREYYGLFLEMGCGKSKVIIDNAAHLWEQGRINALVVVAPKGMYLNWLELEVPVHLPDEVPIKAASWTSHLTARTRKPLEEIANADPNFLHVLVMNVEAVASKKGTKYLSYFLKHHRCLLAVDESTTIKNYKAQRTKVLTKLGQLAPYRRILSGNPIPNGPLDLYSQANFLSPLALGYSSYFAFRGRFAIMQDVTAGGGKKFKAVVGYKNLSYLEEKMRSFSMVAKKEDCLDLPEKIYQPPIMVEMTDEQKRTYATMKESCFSILESSVVTAPIVLTQLMRLHQIACGFVKDDEGEEHALNNNKLPALVEALEGVSGKAIVWCTYRRNIQDVASALKKMYEGTEHEVGVYDGSVPDDERAEVRKAMLNPESKLKVLVANPAVGKFGLNMVTSHDVFYYSNDYDLEKRSQSEDRTHRIGQKHPVSYTDVISKGTVDEKILKVLKEKKQLTDQVVVSNWRWLLED